MFFRINVRIAAGSGMEVNMGNTCIAVDIGASSGRIITGTLRKDILTIKEIYRFKNSLVHIKEHDYWDMDAIFEEIVTGLQKTVKDETSTESIGVDTWGVDYVLLDAQGNRVYPVFSYRDHRTDNTMEKLFHLVKQEKIYEKTGIQFLQFNTIYQLFEHVRAYPGEIDKIHSFLMIPDYINYLLCKERAVEFTNASTTQLLNAYHQEWDDELIKTIGLKRDIFPDIVGAGTILGSLTKEMQDKTGLKEIKVIAAATHDTGSAVVSIPSVSEDFAYISSGTWSLMGIESRTAILTKEAKQYNFTNEGGAFHTYRVLKNIMGLWLLQEVQRSIGYQYSFTDLMLLAEQAEPMKSLINPNLPRFLNPKDMVEEIKAYCLETAQSIPETIGEIARCIFESLAFQYKEVLLELRRIQTQEINRIHIIGGGAQNKFLNQLCADATGCEVLAGPVEATALGNLMVQFIALGKIESLKRAREIIAKSFPIERYQPVYRSVMDSNWERFKSYIAEGVS